MAPRNGANGIAARTRTAREALKSTFHRDHSRSARVLAGMHRNEGDIAGGSWSHVRSAENTAPAVFLLRIATWLRRLQTHPETEEVRFVMQQSENGFTDRSTKLSTTFRLTRNRAMHSAMRIMNEHGARWSSRAHSRGARRRCALRRAAGGPGREMRRENFNADAPLVA